MLLVLLTLMSSCGTSPRIEVIKDITFSECKDCNGADVKLKLDVYRPDSKSLPVILWVHGGGMCVGSKDVYWDPGSFLSDAMTARGYIFVSMDYRLNPEWEKQNALGNDKGCCRRRVHGSGMDQKQCAEVWDGFG